MTMGNMKRKIAIIVLVVCAFVGALFYKVMLSSAFHWYLAHYVQKAEGLEWRAKEVFVDGSAIRLVDPVIERKNDGVFIGAEAINISYVVHPFQLTVDLVVDIVAPSIALTTQSDIASLHAHFFGESWISYRTKAALHNGVMTIEDVADNKKNNIFFDIDYDDFEGQKGAFLIGFEDPTYRSHAIEVKVEHDQKLAFAAEMAFRKVDAALVSQVARLLVPQFRDWQFVKGNVDGTLAVERVKGKRPFVTGDLLFDEIELRNDPQGLTGTLPLMKIAFVADKNLKTTAHGTIEIPKAASFSMMKEGVPFLEVPVFQGSLVVEGHDGTKVAFEGVCGDRENLFRWNLDGDVRFFDDTQTFADMVLTLEDSNHDKASGHFHYKKLNGQWEEAGFELSNIGRHEFNLVQKALSSYAPEIDTIQFLQGNFDAKAQIFVNEDAVQDLKISHLSARGLAIEYDPWDLFIAAQSLDGTIGINLKAQDPFRTLNVDMAVENGRVKLNGQEGGMWQLVNLNTKLVVNEGVFQQSVMEGMFAGMKGTVTLDWKENSGMSVAMNFEGMPQGLLPLLPEIIKRGVNASFLDDRLALSAILKKKGPGFHLDGTMVVADQYYRSNEKVVFAFDLERANPHFLGGRHGANKKLKEWQQASRNVIVATVPSFAAPLHLAMDDWIEKERGIGGYVIRNGTFAAEKLPIAKYVAPFAFCDENGCQSVMLDGVADFEGQFDHVGLMMTYNSEELTVEGEDYILKTGIDTEIEGAPVRPYARHYVNFLTFDHFGVIPIRYGSYYDKGSKLLFDDLMTDIKLEGEMIHAVDIQCFCLENFFCGNIDVDLGLPGKGTLDVYVDIASMEAKVANLRALLSRFDKAPPLVALPLDGIVHLREKGGHLLFNIRPGNTEVHSKYHALLTDGAISFSPLHLSFQDLSFDIDYDHDANTLDIADIQGTLFVGKPERMGMTPKWSNVRKLT